MTEERTEVKGYMIGIIEIGIFTLITGLIRERYTHLKDIDILLYFWLALTILTGIWEVSFISDYVNVNKISKRLIAEREHVWSKEYTLDYLLPNKLSKIFYAEYGAWADREYMTIKHRWSRVIEGTHAALCGTVSLYCLVNGLKENKSHFLVFSSVAMGSQLMNSILYMSQYFIQCKTPGSVNYDSQNFPVGKYLIGRPFMYVNVFWTLMPSYAIYALLNIN